MNTKETNFEYTLRICTLIKLTEYLNKSQLFRFLKMLLLQIFPTSMAFSSRFLLLVPFMKFGSGKRHIIGMIHALCISKRFRVSSNCGLAFGRTKARDGQLWIAFREKTKRLFIRSFKYWPRGSMSYQSRKCGGC